jgi:UDPglucose 6-dehydrogenase
LSEQLDLGYDIFDTIMLARERQAENLAKFLIDLQSQHHLPIVIHGKAYKPNVDILDGSYSLLIGHYLAENAAEFTYSDTLTGDYVADNTRAIVLLAHNQQITYGYTGQDTQQNMYFSPAPDSIVVDPWRKFHSHDTSIIVIHYGNTRQHR